MVLMHSLQVRFLWLSVVLSVCDHLAFCFSGRLNFVEHIIRKISATVFPVLSLFFCFFPGSLYAFDETEFMSLDFKNGKTLTIPSYNIIDQADDTDPYKIALYFDPLFFDKACTEKNKIDCEKVVLEIGVNYNLISRHISFVCANPDVRFSIYGFLASPGIIEVRNINFSKVDRNFENCSKLYSKSDINLSFSCWIKENRLCEYCKCDMRFSRDDGFYLRGSFDKEEIWRFIYYINQFDYKFDLWSE